MDDLQLQNFYPNLLAISADKRIIGLTNPDLIKVYNAIKTAIARVYGGPKRMKDLAKKKGLVWVQPKVKDDLEPAIRKLRAYLQSPDFHKRLYDIYTYEVQVVKTGFDPLPKDQLTLENLYTRTIGRKGQENYFGSIPLTNDYDTAITGDTPEERQALIKAIINEDNPENYNNQENYNYIPPQLEGEGEVKGKGKRRLTKAQKDEANNLKWIKGNDTQRLKAIAKIKQYNDNKKAKRLKDNNERVRESQLKNDEEQERIDKEAEEQERIDKEAEEQERIDKEAEEKQIKEYEDNVERMRNENIKSQADKRKKREEEYPEVMRLKRGIDAIPKYISENDLTVAENINIPLAHQTRAEKTRTPNEVKEEYQMVRQGYKDRNKAEDNKIMTIITATSGNKERREDAIMDYLKDTTGYTQSIIERFLRRNKLNLLISKPSEVKKLKHDLIKYIEHPKRNTDHTPEISPQTQPDSSEEKAYIKKGEDGIYEAGTTEGEVLDKGQIKDYKTFLTLVKMFRRIRKSNNNEIIQTTTKIEEEELKKVFNYLKGQFKGDKSNINSLEDLTDEQLYKVFEYINTVMEDKKREPLGDTDATKGWHSFKEDGRQYNFIGPFTSMQRLFTEDGKPLDILDYWAFQHDISYSFGNKAWRSIADKQMIQNIMNLQKSESPSAKNILKLITGSKTDKFVALADIYLNSGVENKDILKELELTATSWGLYLFGGGSIGGLTIDVMRDMGLSAENNLYPNKAQQDKMNDMIEDYTTWLEYEGLKYNYNNYKRKEVEPLNNDVIKSVIKNRFYNDYKNLLTITEEYKPPENDDDSDSDGGIDAEDFDDADFEDFEDVNKFIDYGPPVPDYGPPIPDTTTTTTTTATTAGTAGTATTTTTGTPTTQTIDGVTSKNVEYKGFGPMMKITPPTYINDINSDINDEDEELLVLEEFKLPHSDEYYNRANSLHQIAEMEEAFRLDSSTVTLVNDSNFGKNLGVYEDGFTAFISNKEAMKEVNKVVDNHNMSSVLDLPPDSKLAMKDYIYDPYTTSQNEDIHTDDSNNRIFLNKNETSGFLETRIPPNYKLNSNFHKQDDQLRMPRMRTRQVYYNTYKK